MTSIKAPKFFLLARRWKIFDAFIAIISDRQCYRVNLSSLQTLGNVNLDFPSIFKVWNLKMLGEPKLKLLYLTCDTIFDLFDSKQLSQYRYHHPSKLWKKLIRRLMIFILRFSYLACATIIWKVRPQNSLHTGQITIFP